MVVPSVRSGPEIDPGTRHALVLPSLRGVLSHQTVLAPGLHLDVDLMAIDRWRTAVGSSAALTRLAVVEALDRWLPFPLDQALVDAERGVARGRAVRALPDPSDRQAVLGDALQLARQASEGVARYVRSLGSRRRPVPPGLDAALRRLVKGYTELLAEVDGGADQDLAAVVEAWRALVRRKPTTGARGVVARGLEPPRPPRDVGASMIDPRQVRARVLALSNDPAVGEIVLADPRVGAAAVHVRVPAYQCALNQPIVQRLAVRIMNATSAEQLGQSVLSAGLATGLGARTVYLEGIVPLHGKPVGRLRADVFDLLSDVPPAHDDNDPTLGEARRATVLLGEWRRLLAVAQLPTVDFAPARRLREMARRLAPGGDRERPLFAGGPSSADLDRIADAGDQEILHRARAKVGGEPGLFTMARGAGSLLVAELAAIRTTRAG